MVLLDFGLGPPSRESQPISNQPICKIEVPAFRGVGNSHNKSLKKLLGNRYTVTPQRFNSNKRIGHYSDNLNLTSEPFGTGISFSSNLLKKLLNLLKKLLNLLKKLLKFLIRERSVRFEGFRRSVAVDSKHLEGT